MGKKSICIITNGYPTKDDPVYAFIQPLVREIADKECSCTVIAPQSISNQLVSRKNRRPYRWIDKTEKGNEIIIFQPQYISVSRMKLKEYSISVCSRDRAIMKCFEKERIKADVLYAHFWDCGIAASKIAEKINVPVYVATGESKIRVYEYYPQEIVNKYKNYVHGVISVSTKNLNESKELLLLDDKSKTIILPNAYNPAEFYPMSKREAREILGIPIASKIAIFVGAFSNRKGVLRVVEAAKEIEDLKLILVGSGEQQPESTQIIYSGKLPHEKIVEYLNAADVFVLPTLAEGCCNAIVEALACGLPIVSSNLPFNEDILNNNNSILINPESISDLSSALKKIFLENGLMTDLSNGALRTAHKLSIGNRCSQICDFIGVSK